MIRNRKGRAGSAVGSTDVKAASQLTGEAVVRLEGRLTIHQAEERRDELLALLSTPGPLVLDTSGLEALDVAGLQLLLALHTSAVRVGKAIRLAKPVDGALHAVLEGAGFCAPGTAGRLPTVHEAFWRGEM